MTSTCLLPGDFPCSKSLQGCGQRPAQVSCSRPRPLQSRFALAVQTFVGPSPSLISVSVTSRPPFDDPADGPPRKALAVELFSVLALLRVLVLDQTIYEFVSTPPAPVASAVV